MSNDFMSILARDRGRLVKVKIDRDSLGLFRELTTLPRISNRVVMVGSVFLRHLVHPEGGSVTHVNGDYLDCRRENIKERTYKRKRLPGVLYVDNEELRCVPLERGCGFELPLLLPSKHVPEARQLGLLWPQRGFPGCRACGEEIEDRYAVRFFFAPDGGSVRKGYLHQHECMPPGQEASRSLDRQQFRELLARRRKRRRVGTV